MIIRKSTGQLHSRSRHHRLSILKHERFKYYKGQYNVTQKGRSEVRWRPGQETSLAPPCSNLKVFPKQAEESTCDIVGIFRHARSDSVPGELWPPCTPRYAPASVQVAGCSKQSYIQMFLRKWNDARQMSVSILVEL